MPLTDTAARAAKPRGSSTASQTRLAWVLRSRPTEASYGAFDIALPTSPKWSASAPIRQGAVRMPLGAWARGHRCP